MQNPHSILYLVDLSFGHFPFQSNIFRLSISCTETLKEERLQLKKVSSLTSISDLQIQITYRKMMAGVGPPDNKVLNINFYEMHSSSKIFGK